MKGMWKKLIIVFMLITMINTSLISSFSNAETFSHMYLEKRANNLIEQRLAIVNAANYLQTERFPFLIYCQDVSNGKEDFDFEHGCNHRKENAGKPKEQWITTPLMEEYPKNVELLSRIRAETSSNKLFLTSCVAYCLYIYEHVLGLDHNEYKDYWSYNVRYWVNILLEARENNDTNCPFELVDGWDFEEIMPGDILLECDAPFNGSRFTGDKVNTGHAMLYLGKNGTADLVKQNTTNAISHASGHGVNIVTKYTNLRNDTNVDGTTPGGTIRHYVVRMNMEFDIDKFQANGLDVFNDDFGKYVPGALEEFMASNRFLTELNLDSDVPQISYGKFSSSKKFADLVIDTIAQVVDVVLGVMILPFKVIVIGWTGVIQHLVTSFISASTGVDSSSIITVEEIVYNKVPLLDINFFNLEQAGGEELDKDSVVYLIRSSISTWYNIIRDIGIAGMLISLIYMGIRMGITSVAEEKAKYKKMIKDWIVSFIVLMMMHYIMILIIQINEQLILFFRKGVASESSLYEQILIRAYDMRLSVGIPATMMYLILVVFSALYFVAYLKRFFTIIILTIFSPIIAISYAIDKIKDGKSQSLSMWLKEYIYTILMQSVHALLYIIFISISINMALGGMNVLPSGEVDSEASANNIVAALGNLIPALVFMVVSLNLESIFKNIFKISTKGMDDVVAEKDDILGYWQLTKNSSEKVGSFIGSGIHYLAGKERAADMRLDFEKGANSSSGFFDALENKYNEIAQDVSEAMQLAPEVIKAVPLKALELPGLRALYRIRHPFLFDKLKKYYAYVGKKPSTVNFKITIMDVKKAVSKRKESQDRVFQNISKYATETASASGVGNTNFNRTFANGVFNSNSYSNDAIQNSIDVANSLNRKNSDMKRLSKAKKRQNIEKFMGKIATGELNVRTVEHELKKKFPNITQGELNDILDLANCIINEKNAKIDLAKQQKYQELCTINDTLNSNLKIWEQKETKKIYNRTLQKLIANKATQNNCDVNDIKSNKGLYSQLRNSALLQAQRQAKEAVKELRKKERQEIANELYSIAIDGIDRIVGSKIKKDLEKYWQQLGNSD